MNGGTSAADNSVPDWTLDLLQRVRLVDPSCDADAVRLYAREIAEAHAVLNTVDLDDVVPTPVFSASGLLDGKR